MARDRSILTDVPPAPRELPRRFAFQRAPSLILAGIILTLVGIPLIIVFGFTGLVTPPFNDWTLDKNHAEVTAFVTETKVLTHTHINGRHPTRISFQFRTPDGTTVRATGHTMDAGARDLAPGDPIPIEYDPAVPNRARPADGSIAPLPPWFFFLMAGIMGPEPIIGVVCLVAAARRVRRDRTLFIHGDTASGEVLSVRKISYVHIGSNSPYRVRYQFRDAMDNLVNGQEWSYRYRWAGRLDPGQQVAILYDPRCPSHNMLWVPPEESTKAE